jgi:hypothetical protein
MHRRKYSEVDDSIAIKEKIIAKVELTELKISLSDVAWNKVDELMR